MIEECLAIAQQGPSASNMQQWSFVVVTDPDRRAALAELYRKGAETYSRNRPDSQFDNPERVATQTRVISSAMYLVEHLHQVPVHVIPCINGRGDNRPAVVQSALWGTVAPAAWSFMLAARARGLGTVWTSFHLFHEEAAAEILGIPYDRVMQAALIPVAYTRGSNFRPAPREPLERIIHWDTW